MHGIKHRTWNVFRQRHNGGLCCAVPAEAPVPPFLLSSEWDFAFAIADGYSPVVGFSSVAAEVGLNLNGYHLFLAFVSSPETTRGVAAG